MGDTQMPHVPEQKTTLRDGTEVPASVADITVVTDQLRIVFAASPRPIYELIRLDKEGDIPTGPSLNVLGEAGLAAKTAEDSIVISELAIVVVRAMNHDGVLADVLEKQLLSGRQGLEVRLPDPLNPNDRCVDDVNFDR